MKRAVRVFTLVSTSTLVLALPLCAQRQPGHSIGKVTTLGNLVHIEVDSGVLAPEHLFDLDHRTVRFIPDGRGYRVENVPVQWDADYGTAAQGAVTLKNFHFPFSGKKWDAFTVATGAITFGAPTGARGAAPSTVPAGNRTGAGATGRGGFTMDRYALMQTVGSTFINMIPGIAAFLKPGMTGQRFVKELPDRAVVTWTLSEPSGGIQAFSWTPTVNRIQAVLHADGVIELSYNDVNAKDGVVGVFPTVMDGAEIPLATVAGQENAATPANLDLTNVKLSVVDGLFLRATLTTRGPIPTDGGTTSAGVSYRIAFDTHKPAATDPVKATVMWTIRGAAAGRRGGGAGGGAGGAARYTASGPGSYPDVTIDGNTLSIIGVLPFALGSAASVSVFADASSPPPAPGTPASVIDRIAPKMVALTSIHAPEMDLSSVSKKGGPFRVAYEGFHWPEIPRATDVACTVIKALGDKFDFIASYSDFRVDNPEGGTPSTGPRGGNVSGIGTNTNGLENYCSQGQLQWMFVEPVSTAAIQMQEKAPDGRMLDYNYAMSQIGHELGHRWAADADALVNAERIVLGPVHWATGLQIPAAFPFSKPVESDAMGGGVWKDNHDGTFTQIDDDYYTPANGYSWLNLYLMGLAKPEEVPDFFILRNLQRTTQRDSAGRPIYKGERTNITIKDVIAAMGPRVPDVDHSQKQFNTAMVVMTMPGKKPTPELISAANAIGEHWIAYWSKTTGGRSTMTTIPR